MALVEKNVAQIVESLMTPGLRCTIQQLSFVPKKQLTLLAKAMTALLKQLFKDANSAKELTPKQAEHMQNLLDEIPKMEADAAKSAKAAKTRRTMKKLKGGAVAPKNITGEDALKAALVLAGQRGNYLTVERMAKDLSHRQRGYVRKAVSGIWNYIQDNSAHLIALGLSYLLTDSAGQLLTTTSSITAKVAAGGVLAPVAKVGYAATVAAEWTVNTLGYIVTAGGRFADAPNVNFGSNTIGRITDAEDMSETIRTTFVKIGGDDLRRPSFILTFALLYILLFFVFRLISSDRISFLGIFSFERRGRGDAVIPAGLPAPAPGASQHPPITGYWQPPGIFREQLPMLGDAAHNSHRSRSHRSRSHGRSHGSRSHRSRRHRSRSHSRGRTPPLALGNQSAVGALPRGEGWGGENPQRR